jgi:hypothetical protein
MAAPIKVYLEAGNTRVFACALDWPGWCRRAKTDEEALDALATYASRYAAVPARAGIGFVGTGGVVFDVVERIDPPSGKAFNNVDFGALGQPAALDAQPLSPAAAKRLASLVAAAWSVLDDVVATAPAELRKGPRGGGRDRDGVVAHVVAAEAAYARKLGVRQKAPAFDDVDAVSALRAAIVGQLEAARGAQQDIEGGWPPRYMARRVAWHVLDHAWEIEDRSG